MEESQFVNLATSVFAHIQKEYGLRLVTTLNTVHYTNAIVDFTIYYERFFEIYISFHVEGNNLRLYDAAKWLDIPEENIALIKRNQVTNADNMLFVLKNLHSVMKDVLEKVQLDPNLLSHCLHNRNRYLEEQRLLQSNHDLLIRLQEMWQSKNFKDFLNLMEANMDIVAKLPSAEKILKQAQYAKKHCTNSTGDGFVC